MLTGKRNNNNNNNSVQTILLQMQAFLMELGDEGEAHADEANQRGLDFYLRR